MIANYCCKSAPTESRNERTECALRTIGNNDQATSFSSRRISLAGRTASRELQDELIRLIDTAISRLEIR